MPDLDLRQLERAAAQGDAGAGERLLRERLRRLLIDEERVTLAAWLGDPAALAVLPDAAPPPSVELLGFLDRLASWGRAIAVRGASALARSLAPPAADDEPVCVDLIVLDPERAELRLEPGRPVVIGRGSGADLLLAEHRVSRRHCEVSLDARGHVFVRDLGSKNGTWLGIGAVGPDPVRVFDGNVLRLSSAAIEIRSRNAVASQFCLDAVLDWLVDPSPAAADVVDRSLDSLDPDLLSPFDQAVRAAAHTALSDPPTPGYFLERIDPLPDDDRARRVVRRALLPLALSERPLPQVPDPPGRYARARRPRDDPRWRSHVTALEEALGLRAQRRLPRFPGDQRGPIIARALDGSQERVALIDAIDFDQGLRQWFVREAQGRRQVEHPHLAQFLGCHELVLRGDHFLAFRSRHVTGRDLREWVAEAEPSPAQVVDLFRDVCGAAQALGGVLSRMPIETDTIRIDADGRANLGGVIDCWVRLQVRQRAYVDHSEEALARFAHLSPEEATEPDSVHPLPSAVYRLGSLLFLALTGRLAFPPTSVRILLAILNELPPPPSELRPDISPELDAVILRAMEKRPADRYPDPQALSDALGETPEAT